MRTITSFNDLLCIDHQRTTCIFNVGDRINQIGEEYVALGTVTEEQWEKIQSQIRDYFQTLKQDVSTLSDNDIMDQAEKYIDQVKQDNDSSGGATTTHTNGSSSDKKITEQMIKDVFANLM